MIKQESNMEKEPISLALYPVVEIRRLYKDQIKYLQMQKDFDFLKEENQQLKEYIKALTLQTNSLHILREKRRTDIVNSI